LTRRRAQVDHLAARLRALGPQATLDRGYALVLDAEGRPLRKAQAAQAGQPARIALSQGALNATITEAHPAATLGDLLRPPAPPEPPAAPAKKPRPRRPARPRDSAGPDH
jgi:exodeoxyribonuclease VII large subunit